MYLLEEQVPACAPAAQPVGSVGHQFVQGGVLIHFFDYRDVESLALLHREPVMDRGYHAVVGLLRGGAYLATMLSHYCGLEYETARYDRAADRVTCSVGQAPAPGMRLLLAEDLAGKGVTLLRVRDHLAQLGWEVDTFVIAHDCVSRVKPDYGQFIGTARPVFSWERGMMLPRVLSDWSLAHANQDRWLTAFDLDGVFLHDVEPSLYDEQLDQALALRDKLPANRVLPSKWRSGCPIITARPECDRERTLAWLRQHGVKDAALYMRPNLKIGHAEHKIEMIKQLGVTEFVESELEQARGIAQALPYCVVWHYDIHSGRMSRLDNTPVTI